MIQNFAKKHSGFTLIELLVVIAIIGILVAIVLISFGPVRDQARDAAIRANMNTIRLAAEVWYNEQCNAGACTYVGADTRPDFAAAQAAVNGVTALVFNPAAGEYCASALLLTAGGDHWCVDSDGTASSTAAGCGAAATLCP